MNKKSSFYVLFLLIGFFSLSSQIIIVKEFINTFLGNELLLGFALCFWLLFNAIGNLLISYIRKEKLQRYILELSLLLVTFLFPLALFLIKFLNNTLTITSGMSLGLGSILVVSLSVLAPLGIIMGSLFTLGCSLLYKREGEVNFIGIGRIYFYEGLGSLIGGFLLNFVLVKLFSNFKIAFILAWLNLFFLYFLYKGVDEKKFFSWLALILFIVFSPLAFNWQVIEQVYNELSFPNEKVVYSTKSIYGNVTITKSEAQYNFYENGLFLGSSKEQEAKEEIAHFSLLAHENPRNILFIGGGFNGVLAEVLKYRTVEEVYYLELDPKLIEAGRLYLSLENSKALQDKRVKIKYMDGRLFLKRTKRKFDMILVNLPGPLNGFLNRFYTKEFFLEAKPRLKPTGLLGFSFPASENYMSEELRILYASIFNTLKDVFSSIKLLPGRNSIFLASNSETLMNLDKELFVKRFKERKVSTTWVNEKFLNYNFSKNRIDFLYNSIVSLKKEVHKNFDFMPIAYFYNLIHWELNFSQLKFRIFSSFSSLKLPFWIVVSVIVGLLWFPKPTAKKSQERVLLYALFVAGFGTMVLELISIYVFQALYGYAYYKLGIIFTFFMLGLSLGAAQTNKALKANKSSFNIYLRTIALHAFLAVYALLTPLIFLLLAKFKTFYLLQLIIFPLINLQLGNLIGAEFCFISKLLFTLNPVPELAGSRSYSLDLLGAATGSLLTGFLFIPLLGINRTCVVVFAFTFFSLICLWAGIKILKKSC